VKNLNERKNKINPRQVALLILNNYFNKRKSLKDIINNYFNNYKLSGLDRRFIFNIVKGTVRYNLKIDFIISLFSSKGLENIDFKVLNILRMGIYQLLYMDRVPDYSTVNESVKLARKNISASSSGFVNAILRRASSISNLNLFVEEKINNILEDEDEKISIKYSYPRWLVDYWLDWYGEEKTILICSYLNKSLPVYIRFNKNKIGREKLLKELREFSIIGAQSGPDTDNGGAFISNSIKGKDYEYNFFKQNILEGSIEIKRVQGITRTKIYARGLVSVQDLSSQMALKYFLEPLKGEKILDVCAAPGGKTAYISEMLGDRGEVVSVDISKKRLEILKDNAKRMKINNLIIVEADASERDFLNKRRKGKIKKASGKKVISGTYENYFDSIFVDAPCSAFGTISRNPDVKYNKTMDDVRRLSGMSYMIMTNCDRYLKPGGKLVFYTCTLSLLENQEVINKFLKEYGGKYRVRTPDIFKKTVSNLNLKKDSGEIEREGYFEIMPYYFRSEGGFMCCLEKARI